MSGHVSSSAPTPSGGSPPTANAAGQSEARYFRRGLGLRRYVQTTVHGAYHSDRVREMRARGGTLEVEGLTLQLAREFGFCYGVERAVDYAYETLRKFPDRRIILTGEIIHNPTVNRRLREEGIRFLGENEVPSLAEVVPDDVIVVPAFGVPAPLLEGLRQTGAIVVDTTCGSVLNVWKNVERNAREGRTSIVHGKATHEETLATVSRSAVAAAASGAPAHFLVLLDCEEARIVAAYAENPRPPGGGREALLERFSGRVSDGFDPDQHLHLVGMANQTTMLSSESLEIAKILESAFLRRFAEEEGTERFRSFDTICSATQDRQDALRALVREALDLVVVVGGYNSSNTAHLLEIAQERARAYHIEGPDCLVSRTTIRHKPLNSTAETVSTVEGGWLPPSPCRIGLTAGASTPDAVIGAVIERLLELDR